MGLIFRISRACVPRHDVGGAQGVAAMDEIDRGTEPGQIHGFLAGGIPTADDHEGLMAKHGQRAVCRWRNK